MLLRKYCDDKPLQCQLLGNDVEQIPDSIPLGWLHVILRNGTTHDHSTMVVHHLKRLFKSLTSNIVIEDVQTIWGQASQTLQSAFLLVIESRHAQTLQQSNLVVRACAAHHLAPQILERLARDETSRARSARHKNHITCLGFADVRCGKVRRQCCPAHGGHHCRGGDTIWQLLARLGNCNRTLSQRCKSGYHVTHLETWCL
mmetsp:Transcript_56229/g.150180  ORF Transcript_56229/g.150180 Transcript_56229/m.150180 type:complete len:201 (-) Transcript_56229:339-941(-)